MSTGLCAWGALISCGAVNESGADFISIVFTRSFYRD